MSKYVVSLHYNDKGCCEYLKGGTYRRDGDKYACVTGLAREAKRYCSSKKARAAVEALKDSCVNLNCDYHIWEVIE